MRAPARLDRSLIRCALLGSMLLLTLTALPSQARAGTLTSTATSCANQRLEHPFLRWLDPAAYVLVPDGGFSAGAADWQRSGAEVVAENEPYNVHGDDRPAALSLPEQASAISPPMCVGLQHPTLRFFARNTGSLLGSLRVTVLFEDATGAVHSLPIGLLTGQFGWSPTLPMPVLANLLPLLPGERTAVAFRFTSVGTRSAWLVDDVYVDPYGKG